MNKERATRLASDLMAKHGLADWDLAWSRSKKNAGECNSYLKRITLSTEGLKNCTPAEFRDTILHEIAHALVGTSQSHNAVWKAKCIEIGGSGEVYASQFSPYRWVLLCANGHVLKRWHRKPSSTWNNSICLICERRGHRSTGRVTSIDLAEHYLKKSLKWQDNVAHLRVEK